MNYNFIFDNITTILDFMQARAQQVYYEFDVKTYSVLFIAIYATGEKVQTQLLTSQIENMSHKDIVAFVKKNF